MVGDYISSGATGWVFEHNREPDKVIKVMKAFPRVGKTILDAFQYDEYLLSRFPDRYNAAHRDYDHEYYFLCDVFYFYVVETHVGQNDDVYV